MSAAKGSPPLPQAESLEKWGEKLIFFMDTSGRTCKITVRRKESGRRILMRKLILSTAMVAFVAINCGEKKDQASLDSAKFTYVKGDVLVSGKPAALGQTVSKDATIEVKNNSMAVLQFASAASITLKA